MQKFNKVLLVLLSSIMVTTMASANADMEKIPGKIVSNHSLDPKFGLSQTSNQYRITYTSKDGVNGKTIREDSGAVYIPKGQVPEGGWPVVVWEHGTVGVATDCAPSLTPKNERSSLYLNTWLSLGFAIVAPDYPGLGSPGLHHYMDGRAAAWSSLDMTKAALTQFPLSNQFIFVGQSQGAHTAFSSLGYQPEYAPDVNILGAVLTGTPYFSEDLIDNFITEGESQEGDRKLAYAMYIYLSAADKDPNLKIEDYFQTSAIPYVEKAKTLCIGPLGELIAENKMNASNSLKPKFKELIEQESATLYYKTLSVDKPIFIGIGLSDVHVLTRWQQAFAADILKAGTPVIIKEYPGIGHLDIYNVALRDSVPFVLDLMKKAKDKQQTKDNTNLK
nr:lipase family protein [Proteus myxofaciens]